MTMLKGTISYFIRELCPLPPGIEFYEVDGQIVFPIHPFPSGPTDDYIVYLVKRGKGKDKEVNYKYGISLKELFRSQVVDFLKCLKDTNKSKILEFDIDGGDLGKGDNK